MESEAVSRMVKPPDPHVGGAGRARSPLMSTICGWQQGSAQHQPIRCMQRTPSVSQGGHMCLVQKKRNRHKATATRRQMDLLTGRLCTAQNRGLRGLRCKTGVESGPMVRARTWPGCIVRSVCTVLPAPSVAMYVPAAPPRHARPAHQQTVCHHHRVSTSSRRR
jgi:hypothetical protein